MINITIIHLVHACLPTEAAFSSPLTLQMPDYTAELVSELTEYWHIARTSISKAQAQQKKYYDHYAKEPKIQKSDRAMVFMPQEIKLRTTSWAELALPYHGTF